MLKRILIGFQLILISIFLRADALLLKDLAEKASQISSINGRFEQQKTISVLPLPLVSKGTYQYSRESGIVWQMIEPVPSMLAITEHGIYTGEQVVKMQGSAKFSLILLSIFTGRLSAIEQQFDITASGELDDWTIHMVPKIPALADHIQHIQIEGKTTTERVMLSEANGDKTVIRFITDQISLAE